MTNVALELVWNIALDTGANILALTVLEAAASSKSMLRKRNQLNAMIKDHQQERLYVSFPLLTLADQSLCFRLSSTQLLTSH